MSASPLIGLWLRMPRVGARGEETVVLDDPEVRLDLTGRSGPVVVEIEYRVEQGDAWGFTVSCRRCSCSASATALTDGTAGTSLSYRPGPVRIRRMLERPFGSVRSKDHTPEGADGRDHSGVDRADEGP